MPTEGDRNALTQAIKRNDSSKIRELLKRDDAKELLLMKHFGTLPVQDACTLKLERTSLQLILDAAVEHGTIKEMLEEYDDNNWTCLQLAFFYQFDTDSLHLLLEYLSKHANLKKMLEEKGNVGRTCLHHACRSDLSIDSLRLLISFFPSKEIFEQARAAKDENDHTPVYYLRNDESRQLLKDSECFENCRLWLFSNHQETFLYSLFPNSLDKTCLALKALTKNGLQHSPELSTIMLIALMSSASMFREAVDKTDSSAPMASYLDVVKKGDKNSDYNHGRKNTHLFREFYGQWPASERKTATTFEEEDSSSCVIQ